MNKGWTEIPEAVRRQASEWVARRDAGLSPAEAEEFEAWCRAAPAHAAAVARYDALWVELDRPRRNGEGPALGRDLKRLAGRARRRRGRALGALAALLMVAGGGWWLAREGVPAPAIGGPESVSVPLRRTLADGTVVEHPAGVEMTVRIGADGPRRVSLRRGRAYFAVAPDPARPFLVAAPEVEVRAVGTAFAVEVRAGVVDVVVAEGKVAVAAVDRVREREPAAIRGRLVEAGQRAVVTRAPESAADATRVETLDGAALAAALAWRHPRVEFVQSPLREVVAVMNRAAETSGGPRFVLADPALGEVRLSGWFRVDDPEAFSGILRHGFGIDVERGAGDSWVLRRAR